MHNISNFAPSAAGSEKAVYVENTKTGERQLLRAMCIVNAAGLWAQVIAHLQQMLGNRCSSAALCMSRLKQRYSTA